MKRKLSLRTISLIMSLIICFVSLPMAAFAVESDENVGSTVTSSTPGSTASSAPTELQKEVMEMTELREETVKHFRLEDGTYTAVQYELPIHYLDENGEWQDIDNTLSDSGSEYASSNARVKFAKKITGNGSLFTLHEHNRKITMILDGAKKKTEGVVTNIATEHGEDATALQKLTTLDKLSASIIYEDILDGVDLEYVVVSSNIKENIIVKKKLDSYTFSFTVALNNLDAELQPDGSISIFDPSTYESVYIIPKGYMLDANGIVSDAVTYSLADLGNGKLTFTVSADSSWINSPERAFPVTIDPPIYTAGGSNVIDTYIDQDYPSSSYSSYDYLMAGDTYKLYWKAQSLPVLPNYAYIADAFFVIRTNSKNVGSYLGIHKVTSVWDRSLNWDTHRSSIGNNYASTYSDFVYADGYMCEWDITDIVKSWYNGTATNYGIVVAGIDGYTSYPERFHSSEVSATGVRPKLYINYRDLKGVEDYWSYSSHSVGNAGTGAINLATGKLSFEIPLMSTVDSLMPITVSLVYNGDLANKYYTYDNASVPYTKAMAGYGFKLNINETIVERTYTDSSGSDVTYYIWSDSDGTEHYFLPDANGVYRDEDGLMLKLVENSNNYTITASDHSVRTFTKYASDTSYIKAGGVLSSLTDKNGNTLRFDLGIYGQVEDIYLIPNGFDEIAYISFWYNSEGRIEKIKRYGLDDEIILYYSTTYAGSVSSTAKEYLRRVERVYDDKTYVSEYSYNSGGYITSARDATSGYQINYSYTSSNHIGAVTEKAGTSGLTTGQSINLLYSDAHTIVRTSGKDDVLNNSDDILTNYAFDRYGRSTSVYSTDASGTIIYGATSGQYVDDNANATNRLKSSAVTNGVSSNYLLNGAFETFTYSSTYEATIRQGSLAYWNTTGSVSVVTSGGEFAAGLSSSSSIYQYVYLPVGEYTLSMLLDTNGIEDVTVTITATSLTNSSHVYSEVYTYDQENTVNLKFSSLTSGGEKFKISISVTSASATGGLTINVDNVMLSNTIGVSPYDMVKFGSFEPTSINSAGTSLYSFSNFWTASNSNRVSVVAGDSLAPSDTVLRINGHLDEENYASQMIFSAPAADHTSQYGKTPEQTFRISGFARGTHQSHNESSAFRLRVEVKYVSSIVGDSSYDGTRENVYTKTETFDFNPSQTRWQFISGTFTISPSYEGDSGEYGVVESITVYCEYTNHPGTAYFDNITVTPIDTECVTYGYNAKGLLTYYRPSNGHREWYVYDANDNLTKSVTSQGDSVVYTYDANHNVLTETHAKHTGRYNPSNDSFVGGYKQNLTKTTYQYDNYGLVTQTTVSSSASAISDTWTVEMVVQNEYDTLWSFTFGALLSTTDSRGNTTRYFYDTYTGNLLAVINPDGSTGTVYDYDGSGRVTSVRPASFNGSSYSALNNERAYYEYNTLGQLEFIFTSSTIYNIRYDVFGNTDYITVDDIKIVDYTYNSNNGKLNTITYGNGFKEQYVYDSLDRVIEIWYNNVKYYEYDYDVNGNLYKVTDVRNHKVLVYGYDERNRVVRMFEYDESDLEYNIAIDQSYDEESRLHNVSYSTRYGTSSGLAHAYTFGYNTQGNISNITLTVNNANKGSISYSYDALQRLTGKTVTLSGVSSSATYGFVTNGSYSSFLVASYQAKINGSTKNTYNYTYDANGNITRIVDGNGKNTYYAYDDLGQLIREDNEVLGKTYVYTYDNAGNRLSKKTYDFTTGSLQSTETYTYAYDPEYGYGMADSLVCINGNEISYDNVGNPLNYNVNGFSADLVWEGRRLVGIEESDSGVFDFQYKYNDEGIRTQKSDWNYVYHFTLNGSQIVSQEWGDKLIVFFYDESGSPIGYAYRTTSMAANTFYYYVYEKNLQGDIVAVYNTSGDLLVSYKYDAWGNVSASNINVSGTNAGAQYNPFRYRGYYYDEETKLYYLNSRYYDPNTGRFLNADGYLNANGDLIGFNMFAYCSNNPVMGYDPSGESAMFIALGITAITLSSAIIGAILSAAQTIAFDENATWKEIGASAASGAISGGFMGLVSGIIAVTGASGGSVMWIYAAAGGIGAFGGSLAESAISGDDMRNFDVYGKAFYEGLWGAASGFVWGAVEGPVTGIRKLAEKTGKTVTKQAAKFARTAWRQFGPSLVVNAMSGFGDFLMQTTIEQGIWRM